MSTIKRLPDDVVNQIAAGEVVERPASVVKELVENALDAEATRISVDLEQGGKRLIRVRDDGWGIPASEIALAVERHATSKLQSATDLEHIATSGFRGEALPSIGSVAELLISSRTRDAAAGASVSVAFSRSTGPMPAGHPVGTTVEVKNLFAEGPARRKFLRAESTELRHAVEAISLLALARSTVGFTVRADGREVLSLAPSASLAERVGAVLGRDLAEALVPVDFEEQGISVSGFVSRDPSRGGARADIRAYVNGRPVKDRGLSKALSEAYRALGHFEPKPVAVLFVDVGLDMVDVNVHPAKTEVRFREASRVFQAVVRAVRRALADPSDAATPNRWAGSLGRDLPSGADGAAAGTAEGPAPLTNSRLWDTTAAAEGGPTFGAPTAPAPVVLGQFRDTYIVAAWEGDLWLFDQHTAHERARFEAIERRKAGERSPSQALLEPAVVQVSPALALLAEESSLDLYALGFEIEAFGPGALLVRSIPHLISGRDPADAVTKILKQIDDGADTHWAVEGRTHRLAASLACHSAVRAGQRINAPTMQEIVGGLLASDFQDYCPHGRPTRHRIPKEEIARWFERTGWRRS